MDPESVRSNPKGRQAKSKARLRQFEEISSQNYQKRNETNEIYIPPGPRLGDLVIDVENLSKGFGDKLLIDELSFQLPAGGIVWTPNSDVRFEILFPDPKFAKRLANYGNTEWWLTLRGEYGGGTWTVMRNFGIPAIPGVLDSIDYNDLRAAVGLEWVNNGGLSGLFEVGIAFEREIRYRHYPPDVFRPNPTVYVHGGLTY